MRAPGTSGSFHAAKAGVMGLARVLARELGNGHNITVNLVTPGLTVTPAAVAVLPEPLLEMQRNMRSLHRDEVPDDVVGSVFFLASEPPALREDRFRGGIFHHGCDLVAGTAGADRYGRRAADREQGC